MTQIIPYHDPALETLAEFVANHLAKIQPDCVKRYITSEIPPPVVDEYPLLQLQNLSSAGEDLQNCRGSIRYVDINNNMQAGEHGELGLRWIEKAIAQALRQYQQIQDCEMTLSLGNLQEIKSERRSSPLKSWDGATIATLVWTEIFFDYKDCSHL
jgi:hypothetical protein